MVISRSFGGSAAVVAPKSLFTVFRVPLFEVICALAIETMRRREKDLIRNEYLLWTALIYTVAFKSLFQLLETISEGYAATIFFFSTIVVVAAGIKSATVPAVRLLRNNDRFSGKFGGWQILVLGVPFAAYLAIGIAPVDFTG